MSTVWWVVLSVLFVAVFAATVIAIRLVVREVLNDRLDMVARIYPVSSAAGVAPWILQIRRLGGLMTRLSVPAGNWQDSPLRIHFFTAGLRGSNAPLIYFASKSILTFVMPLLVLGVLSLFHWTPPGHAFVAIIVVAAAFGYFLPNSVLERMIERRQRRIVEGFPDALDLITVCIEAGLGLDAAIDKVAIESAETCRALAEELHLVTLELRAGSSRERALKNLSKRAGTEDVSVLVAMLIQAERFGSSIADSLTVHSEMLRTKRQQEAEERAAKVPTKLLMPLMFCIFPSMLLVLMGPAMLNIFHALLPSLTGH